MKINIYYGGRGVADDPTLFVINRMQSVLEELNVHVERFNLYEIKNAITTLPQTLKSVDGIVLASTVEWYGIGGYMHTFLDACWLYGDKERIAKIYMLPVVMSTTYGEREGKLTLTTAWEYLGGKPCSGICGYVKDRDDIAKNQSYINIIEKKAENMYRSINQKIPSFPASNQVIRQKVAVARPEDLTPQETERLSQYVSDEQYVQTQKEDIQELTSHFKNMLDLSTNESKAEGFIAEFESHFRPQAGAKAAYKFVLDGKLEPLWIYVNHNSVECEYSDNAQKADVEISLSDNILNEIIAGRMTFQRAFMSGSMKMKGDFKTLRMLDQLFNFMDET